MVVNVAAQAAFNNRDIEHLRNLRLVNGSFMAIGSPWLFKEVGFWLSPNSLERLENLSRSCSL